MSCFSGRLVEFVSGFHPGEIDPSRLVLIDDGMRIVLSDDATRRLLDREGRLPGTKDKVVRKVFEDREILSDVLARRVVLLSKRHWRVDPPILMEKGTRGKPHPVCVIERWIGVCLSAIISLSSRFKSSRFKSVRIKDQGSRIKDQGKKVETLSSSGQARLVVSRTMKWTTAPLISNEKEK